MNQFSGIPYFTNQEPSNDPFKICESTEVLLNIARTSSDRLKMSGSGDVVVVQLTPSGLYAFVDGSWKSIQSGGGGGSSTVPPIELEFSNSITTDVSEGQTFDIYATGDFTLQNPVGETDGKRVEWRIVATGSSVNLSVGDKFVKTTDSEVSFPYEISTDTELVMMAEYKEKNGLWRIFAFVPNNPLTNIAPEPVDYPDLYVSGAGSSEIDGLYEYSGLQSGRPYYVSVNSSDMIMRWNSQSQSWRIEFDGDVYYYVEQNVSTPDLAEYENWSSDEGSGPIPLVSTENINVGDILAKNSSYDEVNAVYEFDGIYNGKPSYYANTGGDYLYISWNNDDNEWIFESDQYGLLYTNTENNSNVSQLTGSWQPINDIPEGFETPPVVTLLQDNFADFPPIVVSNGIHESLNGVYECVDIYSGRPYYNHQQNASYIGWAGGYWEINSQYTGTYSISTESKLTPDLVVTWETQNGDPIPVVEAGD